MPRVPAGLYGEIIAAEGLHSAGFQVTMKGGNIRHRDGIATRGELRLDVQVKCTSKPNGAIHWSKPGADARTFANLADSEKRIAVFIFGHAQETTFAKIVAGEIRFPRPAMNLHAVKAIDFADDVDSARQAYSMEPYIRGPRAGQLKPESGLHFPVFATDYPSLDQFLSGLQ